MRPDFLGMNMPSNQSKYQQQQPERFQRKQNQQQLKPQYRLKQFQQQPQQQHYQINQQQQAPAQQQMQWIPPINNVPSGWMEAPFLQSNQQNLMHQNLY